jgi:hypothetical protein
MKSKTELQSGLRIWYEDHGGGKLTLSIISSFFIFLKNEEFVTLCRLYLVLQLSLSKVFAQFSDR